MEQEANESIRHVEVIGDMDRYMAETLWLEVRRLAKHFHIEVRKYRIESAGRQSPDAEHCESSGATVRLFPPT